MEDRRKLANGKEIWVIKAGFPNKPVQKKWSEYVFSSTMKKYLERNDKYVVIEAYEEWHNELEADVVVVLRGHKSYFPDRTKKNTIYIMWNLSHPDTISIEEYNAYDLICMGSANSEFVDNIKRRINVPIRELLMCIDTEIFYPNTENIEKKYECVFVGNSRYVKRKSVMWAIKHRIPLKVWGKNWDKVMSAEECKQYVVADNIPNNEIPELFKYSKMTVNDHFDDMAKNGFINTRILEALCCGLPVISDYSEVMSQMFGDAILYYTDEESFVEKVKYAQENYDTVKKKAMDIAEDIRQQYSFQTGAEKLDDFVKRLKIEQRNTIEYLKNKKIQTTDKKNRAIILAKEFFEYFNGENKIEKKEIERFQNKYKHMTWMEQQTFKWLPESQWNFFHYYIQIPLEYEKIILENENLSKKNEVLVTEVKDKSEKLQRTYDEKSEINRKLQQTYKEKSEINKKLQITYGEKYDRGLEIKRLNERIEGIQNSKTYRLARWIGTPMRLLRKIIKKVQ
ncbi:MAG: glycosyltransferase [Dorea sp.]|jgi:glycosyltransferase involved in cell wall biosynthesis|nr:glycosyltransferase [Dorea sp.]